jgi:hypothetical protein
MRKAIKKAPAAIEAGAKGLSFIGSGAVYKAPDLKRHGHHTRGLTAVQASTAARGADSAVHTTMGSGIEEHVEEGRNLLAASSKP